MERGGGLCKHGSALMLLIGWKWSVSMYFSSHSLFLSVSFSSQSFPKVANPYSPALCRSIIQAPTSINTTTKTYSSWITHKKKQPWSRLHVLFSIQHDGAWELKWWRWPHQWHTEPSATPSNCFIQPCSITPVSSAFRICLGHYSVSEFFITILCLIYILSLSSSLSFPQYSSFCLSFASHSATKHSRRLYASWKKNHKKLVGKNPCWFKTAVWTHEMHMLNYKWLGKQEEILVSNWLKK